MAKISRPIVKYKEIIQSSGITPSDYSSPKRTIKRLIRLLKGVDDARIANMTDYPLLSNKKRGKTSCVRRRKRGEGYRTKI